MNRQYVQAAITAATVSLLCSISIAAESSRYAAKEIPPASKASRVRIAKGPELESADSTSAIITWTSNNPGARTSITEWCITARIPGNSTG
jgi:hypothetical protein